MNHRGLIVALFAVAVPIALRGQTPIRFSAAGGISLPVGDLGDGANVGFNLGFRGETTRGREWRFRGDLTWVRFGAKPVFYLASPDGFPCGYPDCRSRRYSSSYSYVGLAANLLHHETGRVYEFGGLGIYNQKLSINGLQGGYSNTNLGLQAGVGVEFNSPDLHSFVEFGLTNVFTSGPNALWFPLKFGIRF